MTEAEWASCNDPRTMLAFLLGGMTPRDLDLSTGTVGQVPEYPECIVSDRQFRLYGCACGRRIWHLLKDHRSRYAIEVAEAFADQLVTQEELLSASDGADAVAEEDYEAVWSLASAEIKASKDPDAPNWVHGAHECASSASAASRAITYAAGPSPGVNAIELVNAASFAVQHAASPSYFSDQCEPDMALRESARKSEREAQASLLRDVIGNPFHGAAVEIRWQTANVVALARAIYAERAFQRLPILADALEDAGCTDRAILDHCRQPGEHVRGCWVVDLVLGKS